MHFHYTSSAEYALFILHITSIAQYQQPTHTKTQASVQSQSIRIQSCYRVRTL